MKILEDKSKRIFAIAYIALLVGAAAMGLSVIPRTSHAANSPLGMVIPLYTYPTDGTWSVVIQAKQAHPNVPFIAVINPASGPGTSQDPNYVQGIRNMQAAGVKVLGYVDTAYAADSISSVESSVNLYHSWYGVDGIMFDDMTNQPGYETYYSTLGAYVHSLIPGSITMGNPGTSIPTSYIGTLDVLNIYESSGYPSLSFVTYAGYSPNYFSTIVFGVSLNTAFLTSLVGVNSWVYITDANLPNPYDVLPSYFTTEVATLSSLDGTVVTTSTTPSSTSSATITSTVTSTGTSLTVSTVDGTGAALTGYYVALLQNGQVLSSGYSPASFTLNNGQNYVVESDGYGSCNFAYWQDTGNTSAQRNIAISFNAALIAVLNCGTSTGTTSSAAVNSVDLSGNPVAGYWTTWSQSGAVLATGYTPATFTGTTGASYAASVDGYLSTVFCYWRDGNTNPSVQVTLSGNLAMTAVYSTTGSCPSAATTTTTTTSAASSTSVVTTTSSASTSTSIVSSTTSTSSASKFTVTVDSATTGGTTLNGMWTVVSQNGVTLTSGYTPLSFGAVSGGDYTISVANYGNYVFSHWSNGSTSSTITIAPTSALTLTAYYSVITCGPRHKFC